MRRLECGAGRRRAWRCASNSSGRSRRIRDRLVRRPRAWFATVLPETRPGGTTAPVRGDGPSSSRDTQARNRSWANAEMHSPEPLHSVERRAGPRHGPVISGDPEMGATARRVTGCGASAPAPVGALLPSFFWSGNRRRRKPARPFKRAAERWLDDKGCSPDGAQRNPGPQAKAPHCASLHAGYGLAERGNRALSPGDSCAFPAARGQSERRTSGTIRAPR
jgi:hypothetical protein